MAGSAAKNMTAEKKRNILTFLLLAGLWLFAHPYRGIQHDSILYSFQALSHLYPYLRGDLFFAYGSQDDYSLFSRIYAWVISGIGLQNAAYVILVLCHGLWLWMAWKISALLPAARRMVFLALLVSVPGTYATIGLQYGEMFVTARIAAEAVTLVAIAAMLSGRMAVAWGLMLCAAVIHPLMAAGGILLLLLFLGQKSPRRSLVALVLLGVLAVSLISVLGLWGRFAAMDPTWLSLIRERSKNIFILSWKPAEQNLLLISFCALFIAWRFAETDRLRRLFAALLLMGAIAAALELISETIWHCQLLIQVQPVRAFWLLKWFSFLGFASLLRREVTGKWIVLLLAAGWFAQSSVGGLLGLAAVVLSYRPERLKSVPVWAWGLLFAAVIDWCCFRYGYHYDLLLRNMNICDGYGHGPKCLPAEDAVFLMLTQDLVVLLGCVAAVGLYRFWRDPQAVCGAPAGRRRFRVFAFAVWTVGFCIFYLASAGWKPFFTDRSRSTPLDAFAAHIPLNAAVYWPDHIVRTWYFLGRRSYYSSSQSSGAVFSRASTIEMKRRADRVGAIAGGDTVWDANGASPYPLSPAQTRKGLISLCQDPKLNDVVMEPHFPALAVTSWHDRKQKKIWWLYDCDKIRHNLK